MKYLWLIATLLTACQMMKFSLDIEKSSVLEVPSASGIAKWDDKLLLIGDNSPFLFTLDEAHQVIGKKAIFSTEHLVGETIVKKLKPDFEAMEVVNQNELLIFGSGSKAEERNYLIQVNLKSGVTVTHDLSSFYNEIKQLDIMDGSELNIEAVACHQQTLYLFNRSNNVIFLFGYEPFQHYLAGKTPFPTPTFYQVEMPKLNDGLAGFSGATIGLQPPHLLFTASVELTDNAYDDGAIVGSFLGVVDMRRLADKKAYQFLPIETDAAPLKVESVTIDRMVSDKKVRLLMTTDSDGGESLLLMGVLSF